MSRPRGMAPVQARRTRAQFRIPSESERCRRNIEKPTRAAIVKIEFYGIEYDWDQPYNKHLNAPNSTGTGFVLDEFADKDAGSIFIVTAYHVVKNANKLVCYFHELNGRTVDAVLVSYSLSLDVALLRVDDAAAVAIAPSPLTSGDSDGCAPGLDVTVAGFALAQDYQYTSGTISGRHSSLLQIDCAVNGGNSGGPVLDECSGNVLGVVVSKYDNAQNVNFATPLHETITALRWGLERHESDRRSGTPSSPVSVPAPSLNASIVPSSLFMYATHREGGTVSDGDSGVGTCRHGTCQHGAYIAHVNPKSALYAAGVRRHDLLCAVDGHSVDLLGKVPVSWWTVDRLPVQTLLARKNEGDRLQVQFWSAEKRKLCTVSVEVERELDEFREIDPFSEHVRFSVCGGLVVQPLRHNHGDLANAYSLLMSEPTACQRSVLVVTHILESPFVSTDTVRRGKIIVALNDRPVRTIDEYIQEWRRWEAERDCETAEYAKITFYDGTIAVSHKKDIHANEGRILNYTGLASIHIE